MATSLPRNDKYNEPSWAGLRAGKLHMPRCRACGSYQYPMGPCCSNCLGEEFDWTELSGRGTVYSYVIYHHAFNAAYKGKLPYNCAEVTLDEGVKVLTNIVGIANEEIRNDMRVVAQFDKIDDELTLLRFTPEQKETNS